jgi:tetratricopeptide (TPR) repeat protein
MSEDNLTEKDFELAKSHFFRGLEFLNRELYLEAESEFRASLKIVPDRESVLVNLSATLLKLEKYADVIKISNQILELNSSNKEAWLNLGNAYLKLKQYEQAIVSYDKAINLTPDYAEAWSNRGNALKELAQYEQALASYDKAISLKPDYAEAWSNRGNTLHELEQYEQALASHDKAISLKPDYAEAWSNRGIALKELKHYEQALASYEQAISLQPNYANAFFNLAITFQELKQYDQAIASYNKAIGLEPNHYDAYWNKSLTQLLIGDFQGGWTNYEYRWVRKDATEKRYQEIANLEKLDDAKSSTVLVWYEQGYGDILQFSRYTPLLAEQVAQVTFIVPVALETLLRRSLPSVKIISDEELIEGIDFQVPLMSLPRLFSTELSTIPSTGRYLETRPSNIDRWREKLKLDHSRINIGIACSGNAENEHDKFRSMDLSFFEPLSKVANLYLIQKDVRQGDRDFLDRNPDIKFLGDQISTFEDSASIVENMDLIVTVCTSLAHLAGGLEKRTIVLLTWNSDWRWFLDRQDSPWYSSVKLFRQTKPKDWESVMQAAISELKQDTLRKSISSSAEK